MGFFDYIKDMFSADCCQEEGQLLSKEPLQRGDDYCIRYGNWMKTGKHQIMFQTIQEALQKKGGCPTKRDKAVCFVNIPNLKGFTMYFKSERWDQEDFRFFFEYLSVRLTQEFGYERKSSTEEKIQYANHTETVERYSLKQPDPNADYTSVLIRLCYTNNKITTIKFCASHAIGKKTDFKLFLASLAEV